MGSMAQHVDVEYQRALEAEKLRQSHNINLIASENYASAAVLAAQGSIFTNKYAEGYPGARYYGGCANVDTVETLAIERAKKIFGAEYANVQPSSGSQANMGAYMALLSLGDTVLAMSLAHGGHLTHGAAISFSGKFYKFVHYGVSKETETIDYDEVEKLAIQCQPKLIVAGASAYSRFIDWERFRSIADKVGARLMVDMAHIAGLVAAGVHPNPVSYCDLVTSSTHKTLRGPRAGLILGRAEYTKAVNSAVFPGAQGGPLEHAIAGKAVCFWEAMQPEFVEYQKNVVKNAATLAQELKNAGFRIVSGGTDNHLMCVDLTQTSLTGRQAEESLEAAGIFSNRNAIPFDPKPPRVASGLRLGTPAVTSRGFGHGEIRKMAAMIVKVLSHPDDQYVRDQVRQEVTELCHKFPAPGVGPV